MIVEVRSYLIDRFKIRLKIKIEFGEKEKKV